MAGKADNQRFAEDKPGGLRLLLFLEQPGKELHTGEMLLSSPGKGAG